MKRLLLIALTAIIVLPLVVIGIEIFKEPHDPGTPVTDAGSQVERGRYLATAGNCMACHTTRGGNEYAGGRAIRTQFGDIYAPNITPEDETGIGNWTNDDFWRAMHNGKSKDGSFLYPAFPYPNYTRVSRADSDAMYAYLRTVTPVKQKNREHALRFPYNQRILLAFWRALYFEPGVYQPKRNQTAEWNRGAYLTQGLGHCSACHASRDALGGSATNSRLTGGVIPMLNWYAPSLHSNTETGLDGWEVQDLASYLSTGVSAQGAAYGPMAEVISASLQYLVEKDVQSIAAYLKAMPKEHPQRSTIAVPAPSDSDAVLKLGAKIYENSCAECHGGNGKGQALAYPPLAGNRSLATVPAINSIRMVLIGGFPPSTQGNPRPYGMPPFSLALNDEEVAAVVSYVRTSWGNEGGFVSAAEVSRLRGAPLE